MTDAFLLFFLFQSLLLFGFSLLLYTDNTHTFPNTQEMKLSLSISSFLVLAAVLACAAGDDLSGLGDVLEAMCRGNEWEKYYDCCKAHEKWLDNMTDDVPACFGSVTVINGTIQKLFVSNAMRFPLNLLTTAQRLPRKGAEKYPSKRILRTHLAHGHAAICWVEFVTLFQPQQKPLLQHDR